MLKKLVLLMVLDVIEPCFVLVHDVSEPIFIFEVLDVIEPWFVLVQML